MAEGTGCAPHVVFQSEESVTIPQNAVPIVCLDGETNSYLLRRVGMAVNFLRSGCPAVQLMWVGMDIGELVAAMFLESRLGRERFLGSYQKGTHTERLVFHGFVA